MTHKEYDSLAKKALRFLYSLTNVDELVSLAKDSPYVQDKAKLETAILDAIRKADPLYDAHKNQEGVVERIKRALGVQ